MKKLSIEKFSSEIKVQVKNLLLKEELFDLHQK